MHKSRMIKKLKELKIAFISVYPHTEKVKLLDGTIKRLRDLEQNTEKTYQKQQETSGRLEIPEPHKDSLVPFEVNEVVDNNPEKHIETEVIKKPSKKHK